MSGSDLPNPTIEVAGMKFSTYLGVAAAQWLESELGCGIQEALEKFQEVGKNPDSLKITEIVKLAVALYLQGNLKDDPEIAKERIRALSLEQLMEVIHRSLVGNFEPKDGGEVPLEENQATEGPT